MSDNIQNQRLEEMCQACSMSSDMEFFDEDNVLSVGGVGFFARGDLSAIKAKQKSGKTTSIAIMAAAALKGEMFNLACVADNPRVVVFDTEQKASDTKKLYDLILAMSGIEEDHNRLEVFSMRKLTQDEKISMIEHVMSTRRPELAFIDGIVDLIDDFNDLASSKRLIDRLMQLSTLCNSSLICVLHTNKGDDNLRGHLGSLLSQKAGLVLECQKSNDGIFTVSCSDSRHEPVPSWSWAWDDGSIVQADSILKSIASDRQEQKRNAVIVAKEKKLRKRIDAVCSHLSKFTEGIERKALVEALEPEMKLGRSAIQAVLKTMIDRGFIQQNGHLLTLNKTQNIDGDIVDIETGEVISNAIPKKGSTCLIVLSKCLANSYPV